MKDLRSFLCLISFCFVVFTVVSCAKPKPMMVDSQIYPAISLNSKVMSNEPTIFIRTVNKTGHPELNMGDLIRKALSDSGKRITKRSEGATYSVSVQYLFLGKNDRNIDSQKTLAQGYSTPLVVSELVADEIYLGVLDVEVVEETTNKKYQTRICVELTPSSVLREIAREEIINRTIAEINNIFNY